MKLIYKIVIGNFLIAVLISIFFIISENTGSSNSSDIPIIFGVVGLGLGFFDFFIGLVLLLTREKKWAQGMLLSGAVLLLLSGICCSSGFRAGGFH